MRRRRRTGGAWKCDFLKLKWIWKRETQGTSGEEHKDLNSNDRAHPGNDPSFSLLPPPKWKTPASLLEMAAQKAFNRWGSDMWSSFCGLRVLGVHTHWSRVKQARCWQLSANPCILIIYLFYFMTFCWHRFSIRSRLVVWIQLRFSS